MKEARVFGVVCRKVVDLAVLLTGIIRMVSDFFVEEAVRFGFFELFPILIRIHLVFDFNLALTVLSTRIVKFHFPHSLHHPFILLLVFFYFLLNKLLAFLL